MSGVGSRRSFEIGGRVRACAVLGVAAPGPALAVGLWRPLVDVVGGDAHAGLAVSAGGALTALLVAAVPGALARRLALGAAGGGLLGALAAGGLAGALALGAVGLCAAVAIARVEEGLAPLASGALAPSRGEGLFALITGLLAVLGTTGLAVFMADPHAMDFALPGPDFMRHHHCGTAYLHAAELVRSGVPDVYDLALASDAPGVAPPPTAAHMAPLQVDRFGYPPQFLLGAMALVTVIPGFAAQRAFGFALHALFVAWLRWRLALWLPPTAGRLMLLVWALLWVLTLSTFQTGNAHLVVEGLAVLAMMAFERRRAAGGGALLAAAILSKIGPGLLGVSLLAEGRWRAALATALASVALTALALPVVGIETFAAFFSTHLPAIASGAAYDFLDRDRDQIFLNLSPFAVPFKLGAMGVSLDPWAWGPRVSSAFTVAAFALAFVVGRRRPSRAGRMAMWLTVLTLASLRSPMAPGYVLSGLILALIIVASERQGPARWGLVAVSALAPMLFLPELGLPMGLSLLGQLGLFGTMSWMILRPWPEAPDAPEHPEAGGVAAAG